MNIEIRNVDPKTLHDHFLESKLMGIGSEGCVHKFCTALETLFDLPEVTKNRNELKIRLISPRVPEAYTDTIMDYIKKAIEEFYIDSIVINDYGILWRLYKENVKGIPLILGRTLVRSLEYAPWSDYIVRFEEEEVRKNLMLPSIFHESKLEFLNKYNVAGTELCPTQSAAEFLPALKSKNINVYMHYNTVIASMGRTCPVARIHGTRIGECMHLCDSHVDVRITKGWGLKKDSHNIATIAPPYKCIGNAVYYIVDNSNFPFELCDGIIYDAILNVIRDISFEYADSRL